MGTPNAGSAAYPITNIGLLRRALIHFSDDCDLLIPVRVEFNLDVHNGSAVEIVTEPIDGSEIFDV